MNARDFRAMPQPPAEIFENVPEGMNPSTVLAVWFTAFADGSGGAEGRELDDEQLTAIYESGYTAGKMDLEARSALKRAEPLENPLQGLSIKALLESEGHSEDPASEEGRADYPSGPVLEFVKQTARDSKVSEALDKADWYAGRWDNLPEAASRIAVTAAALAFVARQLSK